MLNNFAATQGGGTGTVTTTTILDGTIANADVASDAAIDVSKISLDDAVVFNESGADKDFRVESDGKTHMLFVDGGNNRVGIGTDSPSQTFEVFNNTADAYITKFSGADGNMSYVGGARLEFSRDGGCYIAAAGGASASMIFQAGDGFHTRMKLANDGRVIIGDGGAEDTAVVFDGNAQDYYVGLDDSADDLVIGLGSAVGTTPAISINSDRDVTISDGAIDFDIASHDTSNGLKLGGTLVTATAAELNIMDGVTATAAELNIMDGVTTTASEINLIDGGTSRGTTALASGDGLLVNDAGTMRMTNVDTVATYINSSITATGAINSGSITSGFGTIDTGSSAITTTGLISGGSLDIDNVLINGTTIGHTDDTDLITLADGVATVAGEISVTTLDIGGTNVTSTAAELNILDGVTATSTELNYNDVTTLGTVENSKAVTATSGGVVNFVDKVAQRPRFTDYAETVNALGTKTAAFDIDVEDGNVQTLTLSGGGTFNIGLVNALSSHSNSVTILGTNLGSCTATVLAGANGGGGNAVHWAGGGDTTNNLCTSSGVDVVTFTTFDGGTNWYGFVAGKAFGNS